MTLLRGRSLRSRDSILRLGAVLSLTILTACGGGATQNTPPPITTQGSAPPPPPPPASGNVTISGDLTYERVPLNSSTNGLDYDNSFTQAIRGASVELLNASGVVIDTTRADEEGRYSFTVAADTNVQINVRAEVIEEGDNNFDFEVLDNTSNNAIYTLRGSLASSGRVDQTRNLFAASGWDGTSYSRQRAAAPFALLDTLYGALQDFTQAGPNIDFPSFDVLWSINNRPERGNVAEGEIGSSSFTVSNGIPTIRIVGAANVDTDEYDPHIITHEFGHYIENQLSRSDSLGGPHSLSNRLDPRVAFSEGWGNALSAILTDDPIYRDSLGASQARGFRFNIESNAPRNPGWYSESSVQSILYDIFDARNDEADTISLGLSPLYQTFIDADYINSIVPTTIYSYLDILEGRVGGNVDVVRDLKTGQAIFGRGPLGEGEINDGGLATNLPVYRPITVGDRPVVICSVNDNGIFNRLGNRLFLFLDLPQTRSLIFEMNRISGPVGRDPDFRIFQAGRIISGGISPDVDREVAQITLSAGQYVISALDDFNVRINDEDERGADSCFNFSVR